MSYIKRYFELWDEAYMELKSRKLTPTTSDMISIVASLLNQENKDRRTPKDRLITEKQKQLLTKWGYTNLDILTKQEASQLIERKLNKKKEMRT